MKMSLNHRLPHLTLTLALSSLAALPIPAISAEYQFKGGYPSAQTVQQVYDDIDLNRAVQAYRFFYPGVSMLSSWEGNLALGIKPNQTFVITEATPKKQVLTANSDTPYATMQLDLSAGPLVVELPPGPLISVIDDLNHRWVMDLGLPGPDKGQGGKHLILPPGYQGEIPAGYFAGRATTNRVLAIIRALPKGNDTTAAVELMKTIKVYPLEPQKSWTAPQWLNHSEQSLEAKLLKVEDNLGYWKVLHELIDSEPALPEYRPFYGELAALGIAKGKPFAPDARMQKILEQAARTGSAQLRVQSLADRSPDKVVWPDRHWEWAVLRPFNGGFSKPDYLDLESREKWFFQAMADSPAMFRREPGAGSLYWLGSRDAQGTYLDGGKTYKLSVPQPVPARLFWSVTVYDAQTRSQIVTDQMQAALRSLYDFKDADPAQPIELYFGPKAPPGQEKGWIKTLPGQGCFTYFRIYGPGQQTFDGSWKPGDLQEVL